MKKYIILESLVYNVFRGIHLTLIDVVKSWDNTLTSICLCVPIVYEWDGSISVVLGPKNGPSPVRPPARAVQQLFKVQC